MTTENDDQIEYIKRKALPLYKYNQFAKMGDNEEYKEFRSKMAGEKMYGADIHPFMDIKITRDDNGIISGGRISSHEGRHRAAAILKTGGTKIPLAIKLKPDDTILPEITWGVEYHLNSTYLPEFVQSQYTSTKFSTSGWEVLMDDLGAEFR